MERRLRIPAVGVGEHVLAARPLKGGEHRAAAGDAHSAGSHAMRVFRVEGDVGVLVQHRYASIGSHRQPRHAEADRTGEAVVQVEQIADLPVGQEDLPIRRRDFGRVLALQLRHPP